MSLMKIEQADGKKFCQMLEYAVEIPANLKLRCKILHGCKYTPREHASPCQQSSSPPVAYADRGAWFHDPCKCPAHPHRRSPRDISAVHRWAYSWKTTSSPKGSQLRLVRAVPIFSPPQESIRALSQGQNEKSKRIILLQIQDFIPKNR